MTQQEAKAVGTSACVKSNDVGGGVIKWVSKGMVREHSEPQRKARNTPGPHWSGSRAKEKNMSKEPTTNETMMCRKNETSARTPMHQNNVLYSAKAAKGAKYVL